MELKKLQENWNLFGEKDPLWAILTHPEKKNRKWEPTEFFQTGEEYIDNLMERVTSLEISIKRETALDFGCGVGRLTQALARHFEICYGIDIATSMIDLAKTYNRYGDKCKYFVNRVNNLSLFDDNQFDLICSALVLQHMKPEYSMKYIGEFLRVLKKGGLLIFQLPSGTVTAGPTQAVSTDLPHSAFKAQITLKKLSGVTKVGTLMIIEVSVKNISNFTWPARAVNLGNHWLDRNGKLLVRDDARTSLPISLEPMAEAELSLVVTTPSIPGHYFLELDMVQEKVAWFNDKGSKTTSMPVKVVAQQEDFLTKLKNRLKRSNHNGPKMEMYGINKNEVIKGLESHGGRLIHLQDDGDMGGWHSYHYFVTK
jgi:ubiquinone/menaquinone biosynthesis C-methylase UbiE